MSCRAVKEWLHWETESLSEADRLVLEDHLQSCESCRADRARLTIVRRLGSALPGESVGPRGHGRAIARALMEAPRATVPTKRAPSWWMLATASLAIAGVAAALVIRSGGAGDSRPKQAAPASSEHLSPSATPPETPTPEPKVAEHAQLDAVVADGELLRDGVALSRGSEVPANAPLEARGSARITMRGGSVIVAGSSQIRWVGVDRAVLLDRGSVDVDAGQNGPSIVTPRFRVEITGDANISQRKVVVRRGLVRIIGVDGTMIVARLEAGESWTVPEPRTATAKTSAATLLLQAREAFTVGDYKNAERYADAVLDASPNRVQTAEARTIAAECAQSTGRIDDALARYEAIAARFADLPAGETALFAAARLESSRGRTAPARLLFERYLELYPSGRFADDARHQTRAPR